MSRYIDAEILMNYEVDGKPLKYHFRENPYDHITLSLMESAIESALEQSEEAYKGEKNEGV